MTVSLGSTSDAANAVCAYFVTAAGRTSHTAETNYTGFGPYEFAAGGDHFFEYRDGAAEANAECSTTGTGIWSAFMLEIAAAPTTALKDVIGGLGIIPFAR